MSAGTGLRSRGGIVLIVGRPFLAQIGASGMANVSDPDGTRGVAWGARGVPETFVVDRRGMVVARQAGAVTSEWLASVVLPLVEP
jgi:cytochrome c biogenesis protein CcmG/thiol:disulfide interchange protein DsbE